MSWLELAQSIVNGFGQFANNLISIFSGVLNPAAVEGIVALFCIAVIIRLVDVGPKIPGMIIERVKKRKDDDDDEFEYIMTRRRK